MYIKTALEGLNKSTLLLISTAGDTLDDEVNALGKNFERISSSCHYSTEFLHHKKIAERKYLYSQKTTRDGYNSPLTKQEPTIALSSCTKTAPGADNVTYEMIKHLHQDTLEVIIYLFNLIRRAGQRPNSWKEAIVIRVLKQGRNPGLPSSYRPIALTICLCKLLEVIINRCLLYISWNFVVCWIITYQALVYIVPQTAILWLLRLTYERLFFCSQKIAYYLDKG